MIGPHGDPGVAPSEAGMGSVGHRRQRFIVQESSMLINCPMRLVLLDPKPNISKQMPRQPAPWAGLVLVIVSSILALLLPGYWLGTSPMLYELTGALVVIFVSAVYSRAYGWGGVSSESRSPVPACFQLGPWAFAALNVWGKGLPSDMLTVEAFKGLITVMSIGLAEELLYRGVLFHAFQRGSMSLYVVASSVTFGLFHYAQGISGILITMVVGSSYGMARAAGAPLVLLVVCHGITDYPDQFAHTPHPLYGNLAFVSVVAQSIMVVGFISWCRFKD
jgi:hypothetical protein